MVQKSLPSTRSTGAAHRTWVESAYALLAVAAVGYAYSRIDWTVQSSLAWWLGLLALMFCAACSVRLAATDLRERRLPNREVAAITLGTSLTLGAAAATANQWERLLSGVALAAVLFAALLLAWLATRGRCGSAIGAGDVKLAPIVGFAPGWVLAEQPTTTLLVLLVALALFSLGGAVLALVRQGRGAQFAFGPALLAAMWAAALGWPLFTR